MADWILTAQPGAEDEVYEFMDPKTRRTVTLPRKINEVDLKVLHEGIIEKSNTSAKNQYKAQIEELTAKASDYDDLKTRLTELETGTLSASDKSKKELERFQKEADKQKAEAERLRANLHKEKVGNAVLSELGEIKGLVNIKKAETLFIQECSPKLVEVNGEFKVIANFEGSEVSLSEAREKWISRDDNKFLLQNTLQSGAGSSGGGGQVQVKTIKVDEFTKLPFAEQDKLIASGVKPVD